MSEYPTVIRAMLFLIAFNDMADDALTSFVSICEFIKSMHFSYVLPLKL